MYLPIMNIPYGALLMLFAGSPPFLLGVVLGFMDKGALTVPLVASLCSVLWVVVFGPWALPEMYRLSLKLGVCLAAFLVFGGVLFGAAISALIGAFGCRLGKRARKWIANK